MEERYGVRGTVRNGIFFTEHNINEAIPIKSISVEISRQNSNLAEVKEKMAVEAGNAGASAITEFKYGQRKHGCMQLFALKWDTESWYGEGIAVRLPGDGE